jgi:hypothetical protein
VAAASAWEFTCGLIDPAAIDDLLDDVFFRSIDLPCQLYVLVFAVLKKC